MTSHNLNIDPHELDKFNTIASRWWDKNSEFKPLHEINPLRINYIDQYAPLAGKRVLDVGCGGGILSEAMAHRGANVMGIDLAEKSLKVATLHSLDSGLNINYQKISAEELAQKKDIEPFDIITCMEMLEHVPDPESIIKSCCHLLKPSGSLFLSTINRTPKAYALAIIGAEYILNMLPKGTHDYQKFIKPSEIGHSLRRQGFQIKNISGMTYNPFTKQFRLTPNDVEVNYLLHAHANQEAE